MATVDAKELIKVLHCVPAPTLNILNPNACR